MRTQIEGTLGDLETLRSDLESPTYEVRQSAVRRLEARGDESAVELLCEALNDQTSGVTIAAAEALARIGNPSAIPALTRALRRHRIVSAPRKQRLAGLLLLLLWLLFGCAPILAGRLTPRPEVVEALCYIASMLCFTGKFVLNMDSRAHRVVSEALAEVVTRTGSPEAREALTDLRDLAGDIFVEDRRTRRAYRRAAEAIDQATATHRDLPVPADRTGNTDILPIPGSSCATQPLFLPRPADPRA